MKFDFSFKKPKNMKQAIIDVRSGIKENGGTFSGNEEEGKFSVKGIKGMFNVSDLVYVTITEKPFIISNSFIEEKVKNFFVKN